MLRRPHPLPARSNRYQTLMIDGKRFFEAGDYSTALQIYQSACQIAPPGDNHPFAQACKCIRRVARTFLKQEDYATVARMIEEMFQLNGNRPNLKGADYKILGQCYLALNRLDAAEEALHRAEQLDPDLLPSLQRLHHQLKTEQLSNTFKNLYEKN